MIGGREEEKYIQRKDKKKKVKKKSKEIKETVKKIENQTHW